MADSRVLQSGQSVGDGRFTLVRALGRGGMGVVWLAEDTRLGEQVALKFLPPEVAADAVSLNDLRRETARSHKLSHLNIIRIHDLHEQSDGVAFISMEFVDGPTLSAWRLEQAGQVLTWEQLSPLVQQLSAALDYAHGEGVIHRDLKPANVMLDRKGRVKLADFGIAAVVSDSVSRVSQLHSTSGTLSYMSPQQLSGKRPSVTDDIYALGATLYELLTSKPPFYTGDLTHQILNEPPEPVEERLAALGIQNAVPPDVAALIMACLAKDAAQRPQGAAAAVTWLNVPVAAEFQETPSGVETVEQPVEAGRNFGAKAAWLGGSVAMLLLLAAAAWYVAGHRSANPQSGGKNEPDVSALGGPPKLGSQEKSGDSATSEPVPASPDWIALFDGSSTAAWKGSKSDSFPGSAWVVEDGLLKTRVLSGNAPAKESLVTRDSFRDFEFEFDWRIDPGGNSGVFYGAREFQLCDDVGHPNGKVPETSCGSLCYVLAPTGKPPVPAGQFHHGKLVVNGSQVQHWLNGQKILEYDLAGTAFKDRVAKAKLLPFMSVTALTQAGDMELTLQNHTGVAAFRNLRLRRLTPVTPAPAAEGFVPLFNGRDLTGWDGDPAVWSVKDGAINARATAPKSSLLIRRDLVVSDFELRLSCRLAGDTAISATAGNIGVRFRCHMDATPAVIGYQMDFGVNALSNREIFGGPPRGILAKTGQKVLAQGGGANGTVRVVGSVSTPDEIDAVFKPNDWNELTIIAQANHLSYKINGLVAAELSDEDEAHRSTSGQLALKLWFNKGPVAAAQIKDIRFKPLK